MSNATATKRLVAAGILDDHHGDLTTTVRWQAAMMRSVVRLIEDGEDGDDLRVPIVGALVELFPRATNGELVDMTAVLAPIEAREAGLTA